MSARGRWFSIVALEVFGLALLVVSIIWLVRRPADTLPATVTALARFSQSAPVATDILPSPTVAAPTTTASPSPSPEPTLTPSPTLPPTVAAQVVENGQGLRLRSGPGTAGEIIRELDALTPLVVIGRTSDGAWLEVNTESGEHGWVSATFVSLGGDLSILPVSGEAVMATGGDSPYLTGVTAHAREIYLRGLELGNRDFAFSMIGDSNTDNPAFMLPFDLGQFDLGGYTDLELTIGYFEGSFSRDSAAAIGGFNTTKVLDPAEAQSDGRCQGGESPLACEYRLHQPSVALILLGTGDQHTWQGFEARYRQIIQFSIDQGVIPVLITKADDLESLENTAPPGYINSLIRQLAAEYDVPLLDLRAAVEGLPNRGCIADGFHYNSPPDGRTAFFDADHLRYGYTMRNLTALQALDALRRLVLY